ncbi:site-specific integrase, partial [Listeria monocytogenes]|nr:site-specific integrase [Listeria monocytogenes]
MQIYFTIICCALQKNICSKNKQVVVLMKIKKLANGKYCVRLRIKVDGEWKEKRLT